MTEEIAPGVTPRTPEVDEVLRRIGRNLLLFQQIEHLLKHLMGSSRVEGTLASMQANLEERQSRFHKQTLGQLAGQFVDELLADAGEREGPEDLKEAWFSFGFTIQTDSAFVEQHTAEMKGVVDARNDLIHHFLPRWSPASNESTEAALAYLDEQRAKALPMRDRLQGYVNALHDAATAHAQYIASPEGKREMDLSWLRHSRLVLMLGEIATKTDRADGWMVLSTACHVIRQHEPTELADLDRRFGHRTLKKLMQATELFDIKDEPTARGGLRTIYRIDPRFQLDISPHPATTGERDAGEPAAG
jgi:hypothetical protein